MTIDADPVLQTPQFEQSPHEVLSEEAKSKPVPSLLLERSADFLGDHGLPFLGVDDLPIERYTSRDYHDREVDLMWRRVWQVACWSGDIPNVGDVLEYQIAEDSIVLVRVSPGVIKGYYNACLHRGTQLVCGEGNVSKLTCPFHGWRWKLDGSLDFVPERWDLPQVTDDAFRLPEVKVDTWDGWVFINMDPDAAPLSDHLGVLPEHWAQFDWKNRYKFAHVARRLPCNWKVALEAFIENYHVTTVHPQLMAVNSAPNDQYDLYGDTVSRMINLLGVASPTLGGIDNEQAIADSFLRDVLHIDPALQVPPGGTAREALASMMRTEWSHLSHRNLDGVADSEMIDGVEYLLFPNLVPWGGYGLPIVYRYRPDGNNPDSCISEVIRFAPVPEGEEAPPSAPVRWLTEDETWADATEELGLFGPILNQDAANLVRVQKGLKTTRKPGVTLTSYMEVRIRHHARMLETMLNAQ